MLSCAISLFSGSDCIGYRMPRNLGGGIFLGIWQSSAEWPHLRFEPMSLIAKLCKLVH